MVREPVFRTDCSWMRSVLAQVTFQFGPALEARYLEGPPEVGEQVHASSGELWVVTDVVGDEDDYVVVCAPLVGPFPRGWPAR